MLDKDGTLFHQSFVITVLEIGTVLDYTIISDYSSKHFRNFSKSHGVNPATYSFGFGKLLFTLDNLFWGHSPLRQIYIT